MFLFSFFFLSKRYCPLCSCNFTHNFESFTKGTHFFHVSETETRWQILDYLASFLICCCFRSRQRRSSGMVFSPNMVHLLPEYPKQSPEDPKVTMIAFYLSLPPEVSQGTVLSKDILTTVIKSNMSSIGRSINGSIVSVEPFSSPRSPMTNENRNLGNSDGNLTVIVCGIVVGCLFVVVIVALWVANKKNKR